MKKVIEIKEGKFLFDDGSEIELIDVETEALTIEDAQVIYEKSIKTLEDLKSE